jgi:hypothetical protein
MTFAYCLFFLYESKRNQTINVMTFAHRSPCYFFMQKVQPVCTFWTFLWEEPEQNKTAVGADC